MPYFGLMTLRPVQQIYVFWSVRPLQSGSTSTPSTMQIYNVSRQQLRVAQVVYFGLGVSSGNIHIAKVLTDISVDGMIDYEAAGRRYCP